MSPQERAKDLINKYFKQLNWTFGDHVYSTRDEGPKECALICVNEILKDEEINDHYAYWEKVKEELEKL